MKRILSAFLALTMIVVLFAGCGSAGNTTTGNTTAGEDNSDKESAAPTVSSVEPANTDETVSTGYPITDSYTAYITAKGDMVINLMNAVSSDQDLALESLSLAGVSMADLVLLPAASFGIGKEAAEAGLGYLGATDVQYSENGSTYTVSYKGSDGKVLSLTGVWDAASDSLVCTGSTDGVEDFYSEYRKTSYGYIGQYYVTNADGTSELYVVTVQGKDGYVGISDVADKPAALTGSEPVDYPSSCDIWFAIKGATVTGKSSDGTEINFEYVPAAS